MDTAQFEARKREHIRHSLDAAHQALGLNGLEEVHLIHEALPELDFSEIQLNTPCLGRVLPTPFYIAGMTAGHAEAPRINRTLALACQERGWAMGVGSQRRELQRGIQGGLQSRLQHPYELHNEFYNDEEFHDGWSKLREEVPHLTLFANIGISQLISTSPARVRKIVKDLDAQALVVHTNALQEALQVEGTPQFRGGIAALQRYCDELKDVVPVILKETGCGFSRETLQRLSQIPLAAIDLSGLGGTHWGRIEGARAGHDSVQGKASLTFANWGEPTVQSVLAAVEVLPPQVEIWASGGVRSGLDAAKLIALGAHRVGYAKPALEAALEGPEQLRLWMEVQEYELKVALFCTGSKNCPTIRRKEGIWRHSSV